MHTHQIGLAETEALLAAQFDDGFALGRLIGCRRKHAELEELLGIHAVHGIELRSLAVTDGDRTGLVEQQGVDVARGLDGLARLGDDVGAQRTVHSGDTDGRQKAADRGRDQADEKRNERRHGDVHAHVVGEGLQRGADDHEHEREAGQQNRQRDLVRGLLAQRTLHEGDHLVEEALAGLSRHLHQNPVRKHLRTARNGALVAARLADHRSGLARDGALVDRSQTLDDLAVGSDRIACHALEHVAALEFRAAYDMRLTVLLDTLRRRLLAGLAQRIGLSLAARSAMASAKLAKMIVAKSTMKITML